ncbi:50S ribosomal protein L2 [Candidatus Woesearchaeota archaeon]|nr:50S ribosomal protein L2 [Candidatus Woesearchaeota archaeon]
MGKRLTQQKRGKGSPTYKAPSFKFVGNASQIQQEKGRVVDIINSTGHTAPLLKVEYQDKQTNLVIAADGIRVGDLLERGDKADLKRGNALPLGKIPEGVSVFNIELIPGDGGRAVRTSGTSARIVSKSRNKATVKLPSGKQKAFDLKCVASIGVVAGSGRTDKPYLKAGIKKKVMAARGKYWPIVSGASMNAVDHPLGGARSSRKGRPTIAPKNAPPGRKVGMIRPRQTGRNK